MKRGPAQYVNVLEVYRADPDSGVIEYHTSIIGGPGKRWPQKCARRIRMARKRRRGWA